MPRCLFWAMASYIINYSVATNAIDSLPVKKRATILMRKLVKFAELMKLKNKTNRN